MTFARAALVALPLALACQHASADARTGDFDGDGRDEVLLRHAGSGAWRYYALADAGAEEHSLPLPADDVYRFLGVGDFDGDGRDDVLFRRRDDGSWLYYAVQAPDASPRVVLREGLRLTDNPAFQLRGIADLDGDGRDDLLLRNTGTGEWIAYLMNGIRSELRRGLGATRNLRYAFAGLGDFNGDGRADLLLRHLHLGAWLSYQMNAGVRGVLRRVALTRNRAFAFQGVGDLNGDGRDDILLRNGATGEWISYEMNGPRAVLRRQRGLPRDTGYGHAAIGDFDGDGDDSLLLRHTLDGDWVEYRISGTTALAGRYSGLVGDLAWRGVDPEPPNSADGVWTTEDGRIVLELAPDDLTTENLFDLDGRTLLFTPDGEGGYSRSLHLLAWDEEQGDPVDAHKEVDLQFPFEYAGRPWTSFFPSGRGMITFGDPSPYRNERYVQRFGTMRQIASRLGGLHMISPLLKEDLGGSMRVSSGADRAVVTWEAWDSAMAVYGQRPKEYFSYQLVMHADGRIRFSYGPQPKDPEEAFLDGIVGLFGLGFPRDDLIARVPDPEDPAIPAHLDLVETAFWHAPQQDSVLVEFTARGPIVPVEGRELWYMVHLDTDEPWWTDLEQEDRDLFWSVRLEPNGEISVRGDVSPAPREDENRLAFLVPLSGFGGLSATVFATSGNSDPETGKWRGEGDSSLYPGQIELPDAPASTDLSRSDTRPSTAQREVFRYVAIRDREEGVEEVTCRIIEALGDEFDFMAFNSEFRVDLQSADKPGHGFAGFYPGNIAKLVTGIGKEGNYVPPCDSDRLTNTWGFPVWMKARGMEDRTDRNPYDLGLTTFAHEIGHTWLANASYLAEGERKSILEKACNCHWVPELHTPAPFPWRGEHNGSVMGGAFWGENGDGTFTASNGWTNKGGGFSWLDLYLMGLVTPDEVPDMFILSNLRRQGPCTFDQEWQCERFGPFAADREIVTMEQVLAATGTRSPATEQARKVFNVGFVYFLLPGQEPDPELLREHGRYRDRAVEHWRHVTGGRGQLTTRIPGR